MNSREIARQAVPLMAANPVTPDAALLEAAETWFPEVGTDVTAFARHHPREYLITQLALSLRAALDREREAMTVLAPNMPESGLVDACRQIKQVAMSEADNSNVLEQRVLVLAAELQRLKEGQP